ncbi:MAG: type II toxin-antitoxin system MqsA family antitoxin [Oscillibacter sp.]|nr:type II toxin-antitoxin system MqsA family antitoxin [Oscillibacter sp.]
MRCLCCKAEAMEEAVNTYFAQLNNCYVIIENVPCLKCEQCGEVLYSVEILEKIDLLLEKAGSLASKILIMDYRRAA